MLATLLKSKVVPQVISIGSSFSGSSSSRSSFSQPIPSGAISDKLFIVAGTNDTTTFLTPSGWTFVESDNRSAIFQKTASAASESNVTVSCSSSEFIAGVALRFRNTSTTTIGTMVAASSVNSITASSITMPSAGMLLGIFVSGGSSRTFSTPTGFDLLFQDDDALQPTIAVFTKYVGSGSTGSVTGTSAGSTSVLNAVLLGLT